MSQEVELKLSLPQVAVNSVVTALGAPERVLNLENQYLDTPDLKLNRAHAALRIRKSQHGYVQTLKNKGTAVAGLHQRGEWEYPIASNAIEWDKFADLDLDSSLQEQIVELFSTNFERKLWHIREGQSLIEVVLDEGQVCTQEHCIALCEMELELKQGNVEDVFNLAMSLSDQHPLVPCDINKAERGYGLIDETISFYQSPFDGTNSVIENHSDYLQDALVRMSRTWDDFTQQENLWALLVLLRQISGIVLVLRTSAANSDLVAKFSVLQNDLTALLEKAQVPMALYLDEHSHSRGLSQRILKNIHASLWNDIEIWMLKNELGKAMLALGHWLHQGNAKQTWQIDLVTLTTSNILKNAQNLSDVHQLQGLADIYKRYDASAYSLIKPLVNLNIVILGMMNAKNSALGADQERKAKLDSWARRLTVMQRHLQQAQNHAQHGWL
ncbi:CYTH domain-containing protein [Bermanella sp. R86510]|uniref:CYTH domain-containing protein n=1 Tax=unclassified Bermanella TaxID=2627862 RepID=UPI0037C65D3A